MSEISEKVRVLIRDFESGVVAVCDVDGGLERLTESRKLLVKAIAELEADQKRLERAMRKYDFDRQMINEWPHDWM